AKSHCFAASSAAFAKKRLPAEAISALETLPAVSTRTLITVRTVPRIVLRDFSDTSGEIWLSTSPGVTAPALMLASRSGTNGATDFFGDKGDFNAAGEALAERSSFSASGFSFLACIESLACGALNGEACVDWPALGSMDFPSCWGCDFGTSAGGGAAVGWGPG